MIPRHPSTASHPSPSHLLTPPTAPLHTLPFTPPYTRVYTLFSIICNCSAKQYTTSYTFAVTLPLLNADSHRATIPRFIEHWWSSFKSLLPQSLAASSPDKALTSPLLQQRAHDRPPQTSTQACVLCVCVCAACVFMCVCVCVVMVNCVSIAHFVLLSQLSERGRGSSLSMYCVHYYACSFLLNPVS